MMWCNISARMTLDATLDPELRKCNCTASIIRRMSDCPDDGRQSTSRLHRAISQKACNLHTCHQENVKSHQVLLCPSTRYVQHNSDYVCFPIHPTRKFLLFHRSFPFCFLWMLPFSVSVNSEMN